MATKTPVHANRRAMSAATQTSSGFVTKPRKINVALNNQELMLAGQLSRLIAPPFQTLNVQDVLRIALAQLGEIHRSRLDADAPRRIK
jgi:hypothetical protein